MALCFVTYCEYFCSVFMRIYHLEIWQLNYLDVAFDFGLCHINIFPFNFVVQFLLRFFISACKDVTTPKMPLFGFLYQYQFGQCVSSWWSLVWLKWWIFCHHSSRTFWYIFSVTLSVAVNGSLYRYYLYGLRVWFSWLLIPSVEDVQLFPWRSFKSISHVYDPYSS